MCWWRIGFSFLVDREGGLYAEEIGMAFLFVFFFFYYLIFCSFSLFVNYDDGTRHEIYRCSGGDVVVLLDGVCEM